MSPLKIFNDPVHGFIEVPQGILLDLINHPYMQRLRRIKQLALSSLVYPGAEHTRFNHVLGAMFLTRQALDVLIAKNIEISNEEYEATLIAILLHDLGHGPFSHALESVIIPGLHHENMSIALMQELNTQFNNKLDLAIEIFENRYDKLFLHQLVSSQLDMDRMDYLMRDSFFTGVQEGIVGTDRIIKTLTVKDKKLVVEEKGIYSVEKFIIARRLMYWQVYLHKTTLVAECMMVNTLKRAKALFLAQKLNYCTPVLAYFMGLENAKISDKTIREFVKLEDADIWFAIKQWQYESDRILSDLSNRLVSRKLLKLRFTKNPIEEESLNKYKLKFEEKMKLNDNEIDFYVIDGNVSNLAYLEGSKEPIMILFKNGDLIDIASASDMGNIEALSKPVYKHYLVLPE